MNIHDQLAIESPSGTNFTVFALAHGAYVQIVTHGLSESRQPALAADAPFAHIELYTFLSKPDRLSGAAPLKTVMEYMGKIGTQVHANASSALNGRETVSLSRLDGSPLHFGVLDLGVREPNFPHLFVMPLLAADHQKATATGIRALWDALPKSTPEQRANASWSMLFRSS